MYTVLIVLHVVLAAGLIAIVLVQRGPGATMGAAFGAGASGTVFGSRGSASFLIKLTSWMGVAFFAISLSMAVMIARSGNVGASPDDLGVVGNVQTLPTAEQVERGEAGIEVEGQPVQADDEDEFLDLPPEDAGEEADEDVFPEPPES